VRRFLLGTAILGRMNASLCDAVMESADAQALLEDLERRSLFVMPLDDRREWYRYHHLFADVLQSQATTADAAAVRAAHDRASAWHEQNGVVADAVHHALAAENVERAADLLERTLPEKNRSYESAKWLARVKTLPDALVRSRPALSMGYAWGLLNSGELEAAEPRLCDVERWLDEHADARLSSELAAARVYLNQSLGDTPGTLEHAERNLALIPRDNHAARATGVALVALARWGRGELEAAHWTFSEALGEMRLAGQDLDVIRGMFVLGDLRAAQGRLRDAAEAYAQGLKAAGEAGPSAPVETDELHLGLAELHREWNDLPAAAAHLDAIVRAADYATYRGNRLRWCTAMAAVAEARGNLARAFVELEEAEHNERRDPIPRVRPIPALKARVRILQGRFEDAVDWARHANITAHDDLTYLHEFEHMVFARVLIARADKDVVPFLERLQVAAQRGGRAGSVIEILVLQALAQQALGSARPALDALAQAITLAEPEGFLRVFLDNGDRMRELLKTATARGLAGEYTRRVLAAFDAPEQPVIPVSTSPDGMMQALTTREHEILRLISGGLRNQEIAETLSISAATVKRHIANAYGKLGAGHRTEALKKAAELKLL
jgi:LuxR family maltose regulon positive regulatory protein